MQSQRQNDWPLQQQSFLLKGKNAFQAWCNSNTLLKQRTQVLQSLQDSGEVLVRQETAESKCGSLVEFVFFPNLPICAVESLPNSFNFGTIISLPPRIASP